MADEIANVTAFLNEQEIEYNNETILIEDLKFENKYLEEPLFPIKAIAYKQDIPNSISGITSFINEEIELILRDDENISVVEESGVKAPLEMMNKWGIIII
jgi:hypothetical protein